jgi:hypothetical protein
MPRLAAFGGQRRPGAGGQSPPTQPLSVSASALSSFSASVSWSEPSSNGGSSITSYIVTASPGGATATTSGTSVTVPGLSPITTYTFTVVAVNARGSSQSSVPSNSVTTPNGVSWATASGQLASIYTQQSMSAVTLSASNNANQSMTYSVVSGSLQSGLSLSSTSGVISGTPTGVSDYSSNTCSFTVRATASGGDYADRAFTILTTSRYVGYSCFTTNEGYTLSGSSPSGYTFNRVDFCSYGTPNGGCGGFSYSGCNSGSSNGYNPTPTTSFSVGANNGTWGDPCGGTYKRMYIQLSYGPF